LSDDGDESLKTAVRLLQQGKILAIKGIGGFHLAVDACNSVAVKELRRRKVRDAKPFALMVTDLEAVSAIAVASSLEERLLSGSERPIVLLKKRNRLEAEKGERRVAVKVAPGSHYLGIMLPASPLHHLLLNDFGSPLVMTSGNRSTEPIAFRNNEALERLAGIADAYLVHNRPIHTRLDDSVIRVFRGNPLFLRRSRGYAPRALTLRDEQPSILAVGAELKGACCLTRGSQAFMSQHIGDVQNVETLESLADTVEQLKSLLQIKPVAVAHDMHPDYLSTRFAQERTGLPTIAVQHHHAHMASCMAENRLSGTAIGIIFDGTGFGPDGTVWGGEFLVGDCSAYNRLARFRPVPLPGGDAAVREPYRMALSWCYAALGDAGLGIPLAGWTALSDQEQQLLRIVLQKRINSPLTSSCGRLFDAVATLIGLRGVISYEGQAAIEMEAVAENGSPSLAYPFDILEADGLLEIDWRPLFIALLNDLQAGAQQADMARSFHAVVASASLEICRRIQCTTGVEQVVLSGGVFQNRLLTEELCILLSGAGFRVYTHRLVPPNDGGLALGQSVIAGRKISCV
jgi:hydrogenase maturation protein HypF